MSSGKSAHDVVAAVRRRARRALAGKRPYFAGNATIGRNVRFGRNVVFDCDHVTIGDGTVFGDDVHVQAEEFEIGDYGTVYRACFFPGPGSIAIGHNFWLGTTAIVDAAGGVEIGNNVGVGPHSQLWSHAVFGDVLIGCRFNGSKPLSIGDDAWLVGHCLVSPVSIAERSMAMPGSLITRDMRSDRTYAGAPAVDVTDKLGPQFKPTTIACRLEMMQGRLAEFCEAHGDQARSAVLITADAAAAAAADPGVTVFNVAERTYTKRGTRLEHDLMRFLLPTAKFVPADSLEP